jgi:formiminotetrahydrofolate cyclodeaminase
MPRLTELTLVELLTAFQSTDPTPGGGSASALSGAVGASLLAMVGGLPSPRAAAAEDQERLKAARTQCLRLAERLAVLVDRDSDAYETVMLAYRRPRGTPEERTARSAAIQDGLRLASDVPLEVMRLCADATEQATVVAELANPNASSDVQVGVELLLAGLRGARMNVEINLGQLKDAAYVAAAGEEVTRLTAAADRQVATAREVLPPQRPA